MKKLLITLMLLLSFLFSNSIYASAHPITVKVNNNNVEPYINSDNRTLVPVRFTAYQLGAMVSYDDRKDKINRNWELKQKVDAATTEDEVRAIKW